MSKASRITLFCRSIADSVLFKGFIIVLIVIAGILVGLETYPEILRTHAPTLYLVDRIIIWIFVIEILMRLGAYGKRFTRFFADAWNLFDFVIVGACLLPFNAEYLAVLRLARVLRVLRLITILPKLQMLVGALLKSIPSIGYISILLGLHFYIYACLGSFLFAENDPLHFGNLHRSMLTLFEIVTLEGWVDVMNIQMYGSNLFDTGNPFVEYTQAQARPIAAPVFFISFILFGTMIILNLFIGVIMNGMAEMQAEHSARELEEKRLRDKLTMADEVHLLVNNMETIKNQLYILRHRLEHNGLADAKLPPE